MMTQDETISLEKRIELDRYDPPTIVYDVYTDGDQSFELRLVDSIPEAFDPSELLFHPDDSECWTVADGQLVFERQVGPDGGLETLFGVETDDPEQLEAFATQPTVEAALVEDGSKESDRDWMPVPADELEVRGLAAVEDEDTVTAVASDGGETETAVEQAVSDETSAETSGSTRIESAIPSKDDLDGDDTGSSLAVDVSETGEGDDGAQTAGPGDDVVERFVSAVEAGELSETQRETLREALGLDAVGSVNARLNHCQSRLSDLSAYIDELEEFLDEEGSGKQFIEGVRTDLAELEEGMAALESEMATATTEQALLRERVDETEDQLSTVETVEQDLESVETRLDETTSSLEREIEALRGTVQDLADWQETVTEVFAAEMSKNS